MKVFILRGKYANGCTYIAKGTDRTKLEHDAFDAGVVPQTVRVSVHRG